MDLGGARTGNCCTKHPRCGAAGNLTITMKSTPTAYDNIMRGARALGIDHMFCVLSAGADRILGVPYASPESISITPLETFCRAHWQRDAINTLHGPGVRSYREANGLHPAMQICFRPDGMVDIDYDYAAPVDVVGAFWHWGEVLMNRLRRSKTNQKRIAAMLDKRFGPAQPETTEKTYA
jgi:hypothetical protein